MDPLIPKAVWGFNGTERPGAVYLAAVLAAHTQKGLPGVRHLRARRPGRRRRHHPGRRAGEDPALRAGGHRRGDPAWQVLPVPGRRLDGHRRAPSWTSRSSRSTWACASRPSTCPRSIAGWSGGSTTPWSSSRVSPGPRPTAARVTTTTPRTSEDPRGARRRLGDRRQDDPHRPRPAGRQPAARRAGLRRGGDGPQRDPGRVPGPARSGRTIRPTATSWRRSSTPASTGTGSARRTCSRPRTTGSTARRCCCRYLLTNRAQIFADVRTYWSPDAVERVTGYRPDGRRRRRVHPPHQLRGGHPGRHGRDDGRATATRR